MDFSIGIVLGIMMCWISEMIQHNAMKKYIEKKVIEEIEVWKTIDKMN